MHTSLPMNRHTLVTHRMGTSGVDRWAEMQGPQSGEDRLEALTAIQKSLEALPRQLTGERLRVLEELSEHYAARFRLHKVSAVFCEGLLGGELPNILAQVDRRQLIEALNDRVGTTIPGVVKRSFLAPAVGIAGDLLIRKKASWNGALAVSLIRQLARHQNV